MPKSKVALDITNINNFVYDMSHCIKCKGCSWVDHTYMPGVRFSQRCPSAARYLFDTYGAYGRERMALGIIEGRVEYTEKTLEIIYACQLCGACDVGCKRNLDLEIELSLEAMRVKAVKDGAGPMPAHKKIARNIAETHNRFGSAHEDRAKWLPKGITPAKKADVMYFAGCTSSYQRKEIAAATAKILNAAGPFSLMADEWCCGNVVFSVGMIDEAKKLAERNIKAIRASGARIVVASCAECYRTLKVDYPKMLNIATAELGFKVVHLTEYVDDLMKNGQLKLTKPVDLRAVYHDSCSLSRLSDPWTPWQGERGLWGVVSPRLERRRGDKGVYQPPRDILAAVPGLQVVETPRTRENTWCCGAGRGTKDAFPDFALWTAEQKMEELSEVGAEAVIQGCPYCKTNFNAAARSTGDKIKSYDIAEIIAAAM